MMHGTTSPFYPMIASLDVATSMMDEPAGPTLMYETIQDAISFRKAMSSIAHRLRSANGEEWFFRIYQPDTVTHPLTEETTLFEETPDSLLINSPECWTLRPDEDWHGFLDEDIEQDHCMLDPTKVTILMPGINPRGELADWGIPAAILTEFLDARLVEIARTGDYTALILFSVGTSKGKWGSLLETLFEFKRLYDNEGTLYEALPDLVAEHPHRYRDMTLKELSDEMHAAMKQLDLTNLLHQACDVDPDPVLTPAETYQKLIRNGTEKVRMSEMAGRLAGVMLVPYPPGIPVRMPGERLGGPDNPILRLLWALEKFGKQFPGFEREVHGIEVDADGEYWMRSVIESPAPPEAQKKVASPARNVKRKRKKAATDAAKGTA